VKTPEQRRQDHAFAVQRRENQALAAELARLKAQQPPPAPPVPVVDPTAPQADAYATNEAFVQATAAHAARTAVQADKDATAAELAQATWDERQAVARTRYDDYDEAIDALDTPLHPLFLQVMTQSPLGAEVAYHLATHPEDAARVDLRTVAPATALRELGKLEARLEAAAADPSPSPNPPPVVPKPRPLTPVGPGGQGVDTRSPDTLPYDEYTAWYKRVHGTR